MTLREKYPNAYEDDKGTIWVSQQAAESADWTYEHGDAFLGNILGWDWSNAEENLLSCQRQDKRRAFWDAHQKLRDILWFIRCWLNAIALTWSLWSIFPHGDDPYDNIDLCTAMGVARNLWLR